MHAPKMQIKLAMMAPLRLPFEIIGPPIKLPRVRPTIPAELMIVLYRIVSSSVQPNFASKTGVVAPFPEIANAQYQVPNAYMNKYGSV